MNGSLVVRVQINLSRDLNWSCSMLIRSADRQQQHPVMNDRIWRITKQMKNENKKYGEKLRSILLLHDHRQHHKHDRQDRPQHHYSIVIELVHCSMLN